MHYKIFVAVVTAAVGLAACGSKKSGTDKAKQDAGAGPTVAPIATPPVGVDAIKRMNFAYADGMKDYDRALAAYREKPRDWATVRASCEAAIAKDAHHYDAHRVLASALAQAGEHAAAVDHLVTALAADYFKYGPALAKDEDLVEFLATPHGTAINEVAAKIRSEYTRRLATGLFVVGRRSAYRWPKEGVQPSTSRGELYAFDRETRRYLRVTHTEHQVAGYVRAKTGAELAVFGFDKIERAKGDDPTPVIARSWLQPLDTTEWKPIGPKLQLGAARELAVGYGAGEQLLVATAPAAGRWGIGELTVSTVDAARGKLTKGKAEVPTPRVVLSLEAGRIVRAPDGVKAAWSGEPPTTATITVEGGAAIQVPESGAAAQSSLALSPDRARLVFATAVDPCAKDAAPSLYVADAKTGALKHLLTARSRFGTRWLDATTLAYEDGDGAIRVWDATTGREALRLENKPGIALDVLSLAAAPLCKQAPPVDPGGPDGVPDEPLPPEEGAGPITTPR
ncbi:MAG: hypothetical protein M3680_12285 [Myxococcota bacterium]|nr:hypothetical protein [Myxococcota bacterium]